MKIVQIVTIKQLASYALILLLTVGAVALAESLLTTGEKLKKILKRYKYAHFYRGGFLGSVKIALNFNPRFL
jgi:hypothetical protein